MGGTPFANRCLIAGLAASCVAVYLLSGSCSWRSRCRPSIFATRIQEQEADKMYHRQQKHEYRVLDSALPPHQWQEATAVQFDASIDLNMTTHRPRLVWDIFDYPTNYLYEADRETCLRVNTVNAGHIMTAPQKSGLGRQARIMMVANGCVPSTVSCRSTATIPKFETPACVTVLILGALLPCTEKSYCRAGT